MIFDILIYFLKILKNKLYYLEHNYKVAKETKDRT